MHQLQPLLLIIQHIMDQTQPAAALSTLHTKHPTMFLTVILGSCPLGKSIKASEHGCKGATFLHGGCPHVCTLPHFCALASQKHSC